MIATPQPTNTPTKDSIVETSSTINTTVVYITTTSIYPKEEDLPTEILDENKFLYGIIPFVILMGLIIFGHEFRATKDYDRLNLLLVLIY